MRKLWHDEAWEEYLYWQSQDKNTLKKINRLLTDIDRNGYQCTGKPEPLGENYETFNFKNIYYRSCHLLRFVWLQCSNEQICTLHEF